MFSENRVHAALPVADLDRARRFYADKLGLTPAEERPEGVRYECGGGSSLFLFETAVASRGGHTQAGIEVPDVQAAVAELRSRGVVFEDYEGPGTESADGIVTTPASRAAWFTDSEGNLIALVQFS
jgi:catechol 2,3-dioxygenase-like lactoylglutathione lyase family enzyme